MILRRIYHDRLAQASYLIACEASREAIVIDPLRDPAPYLTAAEDEDVRIVAVAETHVHADFLSGAEALARVAGAELLLSAEGGDESAARVRRSGARGLRHGESISLGRVRLEARHTPGHTPEHVVFVVTDEAVSDVALGIATGDFLFVGDVGRPDLLERAVGIEGSMRGAAADLFRSLQEFRAVPEYVQIWPGHGAGSACGKSLGAVPQSTLGYELRTNWAFQVPDEAEFVGAVLGDQPEPPAYFARMKRLNASGVPPMPASGRADASLLRARVEGGALVVDTRTPEEFLACHLEGSINVPLGRSALTWAGSVLDPERELVLLMSPGSLHEADDFVRDLALIGYDRVLGVLPARDLDTFAPRVVGTIATVGPRDLPARSAGARIVDVRTEAEWNEAHLPGAEHVPLARLTARLDDLRTGAPIVTYCQSGARSSVAASVLRASGVRDVSSLDGGFDAWLREAHVTAAAEQGT